MSIDWIAEAKQTHQQAADLVASVRPQRESYAEAQRELDQLHAALSVVDETIHDYKYNGSTSITEVEYRDAVSAAKELQVKIAELRPIVDRRKADADTAGRKMQYQAIGVKRELENRLRAAQQDELRRVLDALDGRPV